jgi:hypothetical protein
MKNFDYVEQYAKKLKHDGSLFKQQKMLIESQLKASSSLFNNMFAGVDFKEIPRAHLRSSGLI